MSAARPNRQPSLSRERGRRWRSRPLLSAGVKLAAVLAPALAAAAVSFGLSRLLPVPRGAVAVALWWTVFLAATIATWLVCVRALRRLLPLAALLDLTLLFPDAAPSRFAVLRRQASPRHLEQQLWQVRAMGPDAEPGRRAQTILELAAALSVHDSRTRGHSERVRMFTDLLAQEMHLDQPDADRLRWAALLHDIGKLTVAADVLNKPGRPDPEEWNALHRHPSEGHRLTAPLHDWLGPWADAVRDHHERFDGSGYPRGLKGDAISLGGRMITVADSYETMTAGRPYQPALSVVAAREELVRMSGTQFDPFVVRAFVSISLGSLWRVIGVAALLAEVPVLAVIAGRMSGFKPRVASALATTVAVAGVLVAGVFMTPVAEHGPPAPTAGVTGHSRPVQPAPPEQPAESPASPVPATNAPVAAAPPLASAPGSAPGSGSGRVPTPPASGPPAQSAGTTAPSYPPGISNQSSPPPGIAKNPNALTGWRAHH